MHSAKDNNSLIKHIFLATDTYTSKYTFKTDPIYNCELIKVVFVLL